MSLVTDPYRADRFAFEAMTKPADLVVRSSKDDTAHCWHEMVPGPHELVEAVDVAQSGPVTVGHVRFEAFASRERARPGHTPKRNAMYKFTVDGIRILHTGDTGAAFPEDYLDRLRGEVDVMLAVTGDRYTIPLDDLQLAIDEIRPRVVIPCHYQVRKLTLPGDAWIYPVEAFVNRYPAQVRVWTGTTDVTVTKATMPDELRIYILEHAG